MARDCLTLLLAGHVDHGKSTLAGALLHALGALPEGKLEAVRRSCAARGVAFEWAFAADALQAERDQNVTIEAAQLRFSTPARDYTLIDAPGHLEFLQNMLTGATQADAALLVVAADAGMEAQSRRHAALLHVLGITQVAVAVAKMDAAGYAAARFAEVAASVREYLAELGMTPVAVVPVSAREGEGLTGASARMAWHDGPALLAVLEGLSPPASAGHLPLRLPVQDVYRWDGKRTIVGRIESGHLAVGDTLHFSPSGQRAQVAWLDTGMHAVAGQSVGLTLTEPVFAERGMVISHAQDAPLLASSFTGRVFWLGHNPLAAGKRYRLRLGMREAMAEVQAVRDLPELARGMIGEVRFRARGMLALDDFTVNPRMGRFALLDEGEAVGGGTVSLAGAESQAMPVKSTHITPQPQAIGTPSRARVNGHLPAVLWFSGLSGAGKSTLARGLERALFARGHQVFVLDGDNLRAGLSRDLGFSPADRRENLRRVAEVAALFAQAGFIVIAAFISPTEADRAAARACAPEWFHHMYIKASLEACEKRDAKGLYALARAGKIAEFTGISAPFEEPVRPELTIDTEAQDVDACVSALAAYVERHCALES